MHQYFVVTENLFPALSRKLSGTVSDHMNSEDFSRVLTPSICTYLPIESAPGQPSSRLRFCCLYMVSPTMALHTF